MSSGLLAMVHGRTADRLQLLAKRASTPHPFGLGRSPQDLAAIVQAAKDPKTIAEKAQPLAQNGERGNGRRSLDNVTPTAGGNAASYLTARSARACPNVLEKMKAGVYPSVRAAAKAAGVLKEAPGLDLLKPAGGQASHEARAEPPATRGDVRVSSQRLSDCKALKEDLSGLEVHLPVSLTFPTFSPPLASVGRAFSGKGRDSRQGQNGGGDIRRLFQ
jgi:hypothetical protein